MWDVGSESSRRIESSKVVQEAIPIFDERKKRKKKEIERKRLFAFEKKVT